MLNLIEADRLPDQPHITPGALDAAIRARGDAGRDLPASRWEVAQDAAGRIVGVVVFASPPGDGAGQILALHCREVHAVAAALIGRALTALGRTRVVEAFAGPPPFNPQSPAGLAVRLRPATRTTLEAAGFSTRHTWHGFHHALKNRPSPTTYPIACVTGRGDPPGWHLELRQVDGSIVCEATVDRAADRTAVLTSMTTHPDHRRRGLGRHLLGQCLNVAAEHDAREMTAWVREPDADSEEDDGGAIQLLAALDFRPGETLRSFRRRP
ncbi:GNAT family N-acetyltransferase [Kitasatospora purpeofusca]|uniref:GNAT family N-acetyltransferase n=1 Tax=Kitasatospora purpeofusca TaxID=67352 RepID=UPI00068F3602|nr:GNAT family N-acetyltransferase [Kitasatospora purpeofusca]